MCTSYAHELQWYFATYTQEIYQRRHYCICLNRLNLFLGTHLTENLPFT